MRGRTIIFFWFCLKGSYSAWVLSPPHPTFSTAAPVWSALVLFLGFLFYCTDFLIYFWIRALLCWGNKTVLPTKDPSDPHNHIIDREGWCAIARDWTSCDITQDSASGGFIPSCSAPWWEPSMCVVGRGRMWRENPNLQIFHSLVLVSLSVDVFSFV